MSPSPKATCRATRLLCAEIRLRAAVGALAMKTFSMLLPIALVYSLLGFSARPHPKPTQPKPADPVTLESVLKRMDETAAAFHSTQAQFEWDRYEKVIDEVEDVQAGTIYYRRTVTDKENEIM